MTKAQATEIARAAKAREDFKRDADTAVKSVCFDAGVKAPVIVDGRGNTVAHLAREILRANA